MRISDWSSDVCSSDLFFDVLRPAAFFFGRRAVALQMCSIPAVAGHVRGRMRTAACQHHATDKRSEEHTSELQSLMRISYAVFCLKKKNYTNRLYYCHV